MIINPGINSSSDSHGKRCCRFVVGTATAGWMEADCDYLCDGADDQEEINCALQAMPDTGGELVILDGVYKLTGPIKVTKSGTTIHGNGYGTVLERNWHKSSSVLEIRAGANECQISSLKIDGQENGVINGNEWGISIYASRGNVISGVWIENTKGSGIYLRTDSCQNLICNNRIKNTESGIVLFASSKNTVQSNIILDSYYSGINLSESFENIIDGNCIDRGSNIAYGLISVIQSSDKNTISNNVVKNSSSSGICVAPYITGAICHFNSIIGNQCIDNKSGIYISNSEFCIVSNNVSLRGTGQPEDYASGQNTISIWTSKGCLICGNLIPGKNYFETSGSGNVFSNNKYD